MNKDGLITAMATKSGLTKKDSEKALKAFEEAVTEELASGGKVQLVGFFTLDVRERKQREGRNPSTGAAMTIPASKGVGFKAGKSFKDAIKQS